MSNSGLYVDPDIVDQVSNRLLQLVDDLQYDQSSLSPRVQYAINMTYALEYRVPGVQGLIWTTQEQLNRFNYLANMLISEVRNSAHGLKQVALDARLNSERISQMSATFSSNLPGTFRSPISTVINNTTDWLKSPNVRRGADDAGSNLGAIQTIIDTFDHGGLFEGTMLKDLGFLKVFDNVGDILGPILHIIAKGKYDFRDLSGETVGAILLQLLTTAFPEVMLPIELALSLMQLQAEQELTLLKNAEQYVSGNTLQQIRDTEKELQFIVDNTDLNKLFDDIGLLVVDANYSQGSLLPPVPIFGIFFPLGDLAKMPGDILHILGDLKGLALSAAAYETTINAANIELSQLALEPFKQIMPLTGGLQYTVNASPGLISTMNRVSSSIIGM